MMMIGCNTTRTRYMVSVDWLQVFCLTTQCIDNADIDADWLGRLEVVVDDFPTKLWLRRATIKAKGIKIAEAFFCPRVKIIDRRALCLKLENRVLYSQEYIKILYKLLDVLHLQYKGITRIDVAYDCNTLRWGNSVPQFIKDFIFSTPFEEGHIYRKGSPRFTCHGRRAMSTTAAIHAIQWGSPMSNVECYCYNKSLELLEVKDKPWIREAWKMAGLEHEWQYEDWDKLTDKQKNKKIEWGQSADYVHTSVWRFEISIKSEGKDILNIGTGELFQLSPHYLENQEAILHLWNTYAHQYFDFRINTGQKLLKHYKPLYIFEDELEVIAKPLHWSDRLDAGRIEKVVMNKLTEYAETYTNIPQDVINAITCVQSFMLNLSSNKRLDYHNRYYERQIARFRATRALPIGYQLELGAALEARAKGIDIDAEKAHDFIGSLANAVVEAMQRDEFEKSEGLSESWL